MSDIKVLCIDDKRIPTEIPSSHRVKKGNWYTVIRIFNIANEDQKGMIGFELKEIDLLQLNIPYESWKADRFGVSIEDLEALNELAINCAELDNFNIDELFDEQLVTLPGAGEII